MPERQPVPESEWQKFSSQNETEVEKARAKIRSTGEHKQAEFVQEVKHLQPTAQDLHNEELLNRVEAGELTYENSPASLEKLQGDTIY